MTAKAPPVLTLPADAVGFTKHMDIHLNFGRDGGAATYSIAYKGVPFPWLSYQYDTRKGGETGFIIDGVSELDGQARMFKRWSDVVAFWPDYVASYVPRDTP